LRVGPRIIARRYTYARFVELLDAPPRSNEGLRKLLLQKAPWEG
jgi:uncharacterized protein (DUF1778 family)